MATYNEQLNLSLQGLGLSQHEILVYLACLELGPSSIWEIAKRSGVKRTTCYTVLEDLSIKGFASSSDDGKRVAYSVISPKQLVLMAERRFERLIANIGQLDALASKAPEKPGIQLYEGYEGIKQVYEMVLALPQGSEFLIIGTNMVTQSGLTDFFEEFIKQRKQRKIHSRAIFPDIPVNREFLARDANELRESRLLPAERFDMRTQMYVFGDLVASIAHLESKPFATVIESAASAWDEKKKFELLWGLATRPMEVEKRTEAEESDEEKFEETGVE